jgi:alkanesulfonate monooxygenase SsuD/methylene tetrahydromethanopterin reductase-like flavin-dependent oxidoreductase (luciferase family)
MPRVIGTTIPRVKVGVLQFFSWPGRSGPIEEVYARALDRIRVMDRTGYDAVWLAEHHFNSFSVCPSVTMMGTQVAAMTERLRVGTAGTLAALHHPLALAEQLALLDVLSGGRLNWGAARGFDTTEFAAFDVEGDASAARFREHVLAVLAAWGSDRASYHGEHVSFDDIELLPKPIQRPRPPTWMAAGSPSAITWAAHQGFPILMDPHSSHAEIARKRGIWRTAMLSKGHDPEGFDIPIARLIALAPTDAEAERIARRGAEWMISSYAGPARGNVVATDDDAPIDVVAGMDPVDRYVERVIVWGSPAKVIDELQALREEIDLGYLMAAPLSSESFDLLTDRVLPAVATTRAR